jgi:hypothetical protein
MKLNEAVFTESGTKSGTRGILVLRWWVGMVVRFVCVIRVPESPPVSFYRMESLFGYFAVCGALVKMAEPLSSAAHLTSELAALRARQAALLPVLRHRNQTDQSLIDNVDAVFARVPEYIAKLAEVQHSMDMLAARTANMRRKCENLVSSDL